MKTTNFRMKGLMNALLLSLLFSACAKDAVNLDNKSDLRAASETAQTQFVSVSAVPTYQLIWYDEFNATGNFDNAKWTHAERGNVAWNKYMTALPAYASLNGSSLLLRMDNATIADDPIPYHGGGVKSIGKFSLAYGKVEVRAKFTKGQGSWPAIWMMPEPATQVAPSWPGCGEIDIMEHVNNETVIHQTIHNATVTNANGGSTATHTATYNASDFNIYSIEWDRASIKFYVNNTLQYTYSKNATGGWQQWPFDVPFYIILNQAGGLGWPGPITNSALPFSMEVDYVRVYKSSVMANGGFEGSTISPWTSWGGTVSAVTDNVRTGAKAIKQTGAESSVEQLVTGLSPNTTYKFGGYGKVAASGQSVRIGVKGYGGTAVSEIINTTTYAPAQVTFTTGATNTSATLYFYKAATGTVYGDDFYLEKQ